MEATIIAFAKEQMPGNRESGRVQSDDRDILNRVDRIVVHPKTLDVSLPAGKDSVSKVVSVDWAPNNPTRKRAIMLPAGRDGRFSATYPFGNPRPSR
ncbi:hypothetical protein [Pseudorhodoplanes sp.]|uniref:hypothetical protein n=1 Tax=Pseudorhodoplanes sp. TaxID=1934341 RepID=UPI003D1445E8